MQYKLHTNCSLQIFRILKIQSCQHNHQLIDRLMESFLFLYMLPCVIIFVFYLSLNYPRRSATGSISNENFLLPPGRKGFPILGESLEYFSKLRNGVPEKFVTDRIRKYSSKVFRTSLLGEPMAMLCGAEGNKFLFSDEGKFVKAWFPSAITKIFPKSHNESIQESTTKVRKMLQPFLKPDALHNYVVVMDKVMKRHLETDWTGKHVKVWDVVTRYTFMMACRLLLSVEDPGQVEKLGERIGEVVEGTMSLAINFPRTAFYCAVKASEAVRKELQGMIKQRKMDLTEKRVSPTQDMLSHILVVDDENSQFMAEFDIATTLVALLHGGTTRKMIICVSDASSGQQASKENE
ncbi:unnamed protein product [Camellia sinensis]